MCYVAPVPVHGPIYGLFMRCTKTVFFLPMLIFRAWATCDITWPSWVNYSRTPLVERMPFYIILPAITRNVSKRATRWKKKKKKKTKNKKQRIKVRTTEKIKQEKTIKTGLLRVNFFFQVFVTPVQIQFSFELPITPTVFDFPTEKVRVIGSRLYCTARKYKKRDVHITPLPPQNGHLPTTATFFGL